MRTILPLIAAGLALALPTAASAELPAGAKAPNFTARGALGGKLFTVNLAQALKRGPVVLYFYPKDDTPGCTAEACAFRDQYADFLDLGAVVVGVSSDSEASHQKFSQKHRLPFPLLADTSGQLRKQYEVPRALLGLLPGRVTFVIDKDGKIAYIFNSLSGATDHVSKAKEVLRGLAK